MIRSRLKPMFAALTLVLISQFGVAPVALGQSTETPPTENVPDAKPVEREGTMTLERMDEIIKRLDEKAKSTQLGFWQFEVEKRSIMIVADVKNDRMRILVPIGPVADVSEDLMKRLMQANFDTALDSRYAVAREIVWATYIHPLAALHDRQFVTAIGQTVNLAITFGTTFSSGLLSFGGGDSRGIIERQLIDGLLQKGLPI